MSHCVTVRRRCGQKPCPCRRLSPGFPPPDCRFTHTPQSPGVCDGRNARQVVLWASVYLVQYIYIYIYDFLHLHSKAYTCIQIEEHEDAKKNSRGPGVSHSPNVVSVLPNTSETGLMARANSIGRWSELPSFTGQAMSCSMLAQHVGQRAGHFSTCGVHAEPNLEATIAATSGHRH